MIITSVAIAAKMIELNDPERNGLPNVAMTQTPEIPWEKPSYGIAGATNCRNSVQHVELTGEI
jgi:hypothetical protein